MHLISLPVRKSSSKFLPLSVDLLYFTSTARRYKWGFTNTFGEYY